MVKDQIVTFFLNNRSLEGAPHVQPLKSLDELGKGSLIFHPNEFGTEVAIIEVEECMNMLTKYRLTKGRYFSEGKLSTYFTTFPKEEGQLTMPKRYLTVTQEQIDKEPIYHAKRD